MKVLIVDDDQIVCESLKIILSMDENISVVGTCQNGDMAFQFCKDNFVDVVLMDIRMPICDGVLGTKKIKELSTRIQVLILTTFNDDHYIVQALKNGASGYLLKNVPPEKIIEAIKVVYEGNMIIHPEVANKFSNLLNYRPEHDFSKYALTDIQLDIMKLISDGLTNKEIADKIYLTEGTVKNKITEILSRLNLRDRTQIAIFYLKGGIN